MDIVNEYKNKLVRILDAVVEDPSIYKENKATIIIHVTALICGIVAAQPIPFADIFILTPIQLVMVTYLNKILGNPFEKSRLNEILTSLLGIVGWGVLAQQLIIGAYKTVLPFLGAITTIPLVYATTLALGTGAKVLIEAKNSDVEVSGEELKRLVKEAKEKAKKENTKMDLKQAMEMISGFAKDAEMYEAYKEELNRCEVNLSEILMNHVGLDTDINEMILQKRRVIENRINAKYKNITCSESTLNILVLLPKKDFIECAEGVLSQINYDIEKMYCTSVRKQGKSTFIEIETALGRVFVFSDGKVHVQYIDLNEQLREKMILKNEINISGIGNGEEILIDEQIREKFVNTIRNAKSEICIISPWANSYVKDRIISDMKSAVARGVKIKVLYGIKDDSKGSTDNKERLARTRNSIQEYRRELGASNFYSEETNTHMKMLICDEEYIVLGSYNFLSFWGDYANHDNSVRREISTCFDDKQRLREMKEMFFGGMRS